MTWTSEKAIDRGCHQIGTLGSGNHYLEIQVARPENVLDEALARAFGVTIPNQYLTDLATADIAFKARDDDLPGTFRADRGSDVERGGGRSYERATPGTT